MSAVVDSGSNSRFFRRLWVGREGLWLDLDTLASYSCEKTNRSSSNAWGRCELNERGVFIWHECACESYGGRWQACEDQGDGEAGAGMV